RAPAADRSARSRGGGRKGAADASRRRPPSGPRGAGAVAELVLAAAAAGAGVVAADLGLGASDGLGLVAPRRGEVGELADAGDQLLDRGVQRRQRSLASEQLGGRLLVGALGGEEAVEAGQRRRDGVVVELVERREDAGGELEAGDPGQDGAGDRV